jgi:hypothetical protein
MATHPPPGPRPANGRPSAGGTNRQLTIGECIAIGRYAEQLHQARGKSTVPAWAVLEYIDALRVCTTCGYPPGEHRVLGDRRTCRHYSRDL